MAINKNFVVKNGLEVNTSLIVADSDNSRVGVATTTPTYQFHVFGGIGVTNLTVTGLSTFSGISTFQDGVFITGISTHIGVGTFQDNVFIDGDLNVAGSANLFTDTTDNTLGDVNTGSVQLDGGAGIALNLSVGAGLSVGGNVHVSGASTFADRIIVGSAVTVDNGLDVTGVVTATGYTVNRTQVISSARQLQNIASLDATTTATIEAAIVSGPNTFDDLKVTGITTLGFTTATTIQIGNEGLSVTGVSTFTGEIDGNGGANIAGGLTANSAQISDLNDGRVVLAGTSGELEDSANLTFDGVGLVVTGNVNVSGVTTTATLAVTGIATAETLQVGDQGLSVAGITTQTGDLIVGVSTLFADVSTGRVGIGTDVPATTLDVAGDLTANSAKVEDLTDNRVVIAGTDGELEDDANLTFDGSTLSVGVALDVDGHTELDGVNVSEGINVVGVTTTATLAVTGIATAETLQVGDQGLSVAGVTTTLTLEVGVVGNTLVGITTILDEDNLGSNSDTALATQQSIKAYVDDAIAGTANTDNVSTSTLVVAGVSTFNGNVSIADSIIHTGDTDTSIRFPSAGTFTIHTQGSERLRVGGSGFIGIGTDSPDTRLTVNSGTTDVVANFASSDANAWIQFRDTTTTDTAVMVGANGDNLLLRAGSNERARITSAGDVGIGTATIRSSLKLDVDGAVGAKPGSTANVSFANVDDQDSGMYFPATGQVGLVAAGSRKLLVNSSGLTLNNGNLDLNGQIITGSGGINITGIVTATGGYNLGIHSAGSEVTTAVGVITALDFVGTGNSICFKNQDTTTKVIEINIAGSGGGGGGVTEVDTNVSSTSATGVGSFAVASFRSAAVIAQIDQTGDYQVGRYLMIHDGTTVTVVEESAVSTGATMLGSFSGAIVGSNAELQVTMGSAGIATVTTKIDTVTV